MRAVKAYGKWRGSKLGQTLKTEQHETRTRRVQGTSTPELRCIARPSEFPARGGFERHLADAVEVDPGPRVNVLALHVVAAIVALFTLGESERDPGRQTEPPGERG